MFDENLLDSSPARAPVLTGRHRAVVWLVGGLGFVAGLEILPVVVPSPSAGTKALLLHSVILSVVLMLQTIMLCYVQAEGRRARLRVWPWFTLTLVFSFVGFLSFLTYSAAKTGDWKRTAIPTAYIVEALLLGVLVVVPLIHTQALGLAELSTRWVILPSPPPPPTPPTVARSSEAKARSAEASHDPLMPTTIPPAVPNIIDEPAAIAIAGPDLAGVPGGLSGGVSSAIPPGILSPPRPAPPLPPASPEATKPPRLHVGGVVEAAKIIFQPKPEYPPLAIIARIQGSVRLEAVIGTDGRVLNLRALSGHPLLVPAALAAVGRWRYQPTLLNGKPVEVLTEIDVNFTLTQ